MLVTTQHDERLVPVQRRRNRVAGVRPYDVEFQAGRGEPITEPADVVGRIVLDHQRTGGHDLRLSKRSRNPDTGLVRVKLRLSPGEG